ncbi:hypothetical protein KBW71_01060 [Hydrogenophaga aromaticivorans]|uniref:hypothetical protein n=1 Tax=Hydrogenophaga aromaticivorans TaxID=2610898 RepID=UPI001B380D89|nr:hypothetical protein [Hydrogenophaga aromaticivorans]MBQ0917019.1 hypothetical protein [Hydrogenophaga aromaticivorans]
MTILYAGIGSRQTPPDVLAYMKHIGGRLVAGGYVLRSGAANGADEAFEAGCVSVNGPAEIWLPWKGFNGHPDTGLYPSDEHFEKASELHPGWAHLGRGPRALHARNVGQILGADLQTPVAFVVCWTADGCEMEATRNRDTGGTGTAIALASRMDIPVYNLQNRDARDRLVAHVRYLHEQRASAAEPQEQDRGR